MERGFYWVTFEDGDHEVVEIDGDSMYRCGSDIACHEVNGAWQEVGNPMGIVSIEGPITTPAVEQTMFATEFLRLGDNGPELVRLPLSEWPEWAAALRRILTPAQADE